MRLRLTQTIHSAAIWGTAQVTMLRSVSGTRSIGLTANTAPNATSEILLDEPSNITSLKDIGPDNASNGVLHSFLDKVYVIAWLNETLPFSTTRDFTVAPFTDDRSPEMASTDETLTASTLLYEAEMDCEPAKLIPKTPSAGVNWRRRIQHHQLARI